MKQFELSMVWLRRDLRNFDHAALSAALTQSARVICVFVFDRGILANLPRNDRRVAFIHACVLELAQELASQGGQLLVRHAHPEDEIPRLAAELGVDAVFFNHDYEPAAMTRDQLVSSRLQQAGRQVLSFQDQVIFEKNQILTQAGTAFSVFTPYKNAWLKQLQQVGLPRFDCHAQAGQWQCYPNQTVPSLAELGFAASPIAHLQPGMQGAQALWQDFQSRIQLYGERRDFPARKGPSYLSVHLRFGTISIRQLVQHAWQAHQEGAGIWLSELIWREFYAMILFHHPHVAERAFKPAYDAIVWESGDAAQALFDAWCQGQTGYPLVDAAMLQLNQTGYMHNRLRMVTASFLVKDCGIDWRWGEAYFARQLNDFDLAANNGGWQWCASSGCDAQPYFRIFNPITQSQKFDAEGQFIVRYLPQLAPLAAKYRHAPWLAPAAELARAGLVLGQDYPMPIVQHDQARQLTLARYAVVKQRADGAA